MGERALMYSDLESAIRKVRGVLSSKIVVDGSNNISEVHVLADTNRNPKQIVRDIESSLMIQGTAIDHKKISVVQTQQQEQYQEANRPRLTTLNLTASGLNAEARVQLNVGGKIFEGVAFGPNISSNRLRLVAAATLDALEVYIDSKAKFVVEDIVKVSLGRKEVVNISVSFVTSQGEEVLLGSAFVRNDDREAVSKAILNAINRKISLLNVG